MKITLWVVSKLFRNIWLLKKFGHFTSWTGIALGGLRLEKSISVSCGSMNDSAAHVHRQLQLSWGVRTAQKGRQDLDEARTSTFPQVHGGLKAI